MPPSRPAVRDLLLPLAAAVALALVFLAGLPSGAANVEKFPKLVLGGVEVIAREVEEPLLERVHLFQSEQALRAVLLRTLEFSLERGQILPVLNLEDLFSSDPMLLELAFFSPDPLEVICEGPDLLHAQRDSSLVKQEGENVSRNEVH